MGNKKTKSQRPTEEQKEEPTEKTDNVVEEVYEEFGEENEMEQDIDEAQWDFSDTEPLAAPLISVPETKRLFRVTTLAGNGETYTFNGKGKNCGINWPYEIKFDKEGNGFFTAYGSNSVRKITPNGMVTTVIDKPDSGNFSCLRGLALDKFGNIFVADTGNELIRKITTSGVCTTIQTNMRFNSPYSVAVADDGTIYVADTGNHCIKKIDADGNTTVVAGSLLGGNSDGPALSAKFQSPQGLVLDPEGNIIVADCGNASIRKVSTDGTVTTIAGGRAEFSSPYGVAIDDYSNIYVADYRNDRIRKINKQGKIQTIAGAGVSIFDESPDSLSMPTGVGVDPKGNIIVCDCYHHIIRKITSMLEVLSLNWPASHVDLPLPCQQATIELICVLWLSSPLFIPKEIVKLLVRTVISYWPT